MNEWIKFSIDFEIDEVRITLFRSYDNKNWISQNYKKIFYKGIFSLEKRIEKVKKQLLKQYQEKEKIFRQRYEIKEIQEKERYYLEDGSVRKFTTS